ncbi:MAG: NAD-glutamate dehydrogenase [Bdellovibrionales bacterium]|nr:NAD-glutamate dehydrogenase [Bdellovibrionales bacterium]
MTETNKEPGSQNPASTTLEKLTETLEQESSVQSGLDFLTSSDFANQLFRKASEAFLSGQTVEELLQVVSESLQVLEEFHQGAEPFLVRTNRKERSLRIYIALGDRPFIINSVRQTLVDLSITVLSYLHPILREDGRRISFSYIECAPLAEAQVQVLLKKLEQNLHHVVVSTDDFTPMLVQTETSARLLESMNGRSSFPADEEVEAADFLRWLTDGGLLFLGYMQWKESEGTLSPRAMLGLARIEGQYGKRLLDELFQDAEGLVSRGELLSVDRIRTESMVQRRAKLMNISFQQPSSDGKVVVVHQIVGLLTSKAIAQESSSVPLIRTRLQYLLKNELAIEHSHDYKSIVNIVNSMPKEESLRLDNESLLSIVQTILEIHNKNETRVSIRLDRAERGATVMIVLPRDRFNSTVRNKVQAYVEKMLGAAPGTSEYHLDLSNQPHARFYFHIPVAEGGLESLDIAVLKREIAELTRSWKDNLEERIVRSPLFTNPTDLWLRYADAFPQGYQTLQSVEDCTHDIGFIESLSEDRSIDVSMRPSGEEIPRSFILIVYSLGSVITISRAFPVLENAGLEVINERTFEIRPSSGQKVFVHRFLVCPKGDLFVTSEIFEDYLAPGLREILEGNASDDSLNSLLISANINTRTIELLRSYCSFLWQIRKFATRSALLGALSGHPLIARKLWQIFDLRLNPKNGKSLIERKETTPRLIEEYRELIRKVSDITHDRILRALLSLVESTVRTNFYRKAPGIALKVSSRDIDIMPAPRPLFEIYVRASNFEGIHLRSGPIARGGLRWSDRMQDFRSEVLGLMKTQAVKNALIVPAGAKGGFIVKRLPPDRASQLPIVEEAYRNFIRCLLSVTDNRVDERILSPEDVVCHDGPDPYFVVAADKGTATFSDLANKIAVNDFQFWLGDAFASGGSNGYDHKLYGITAKGAWESVKRHFNNIGLDYIDGTFSAVGIGDMSGDVFGNGLLLSDRVKLLAAFNHKHIFLDPSPDPKSSFEERSRLFSLPGSQWSDYSADVISPGGGVFGRFDKEIPLTPETRTALRIPESAPSLLDGETLISHILKAECDLLWNGGIGTYVKSRRESNADVNDGTNDNVRVNADELRAKVIGEGGNLGFTQKARIDFARRGGHLNTDAIDNSGGVDLSDHEVNLKILFSQAIRKGHLTFDERNKILLEVVETVVDQVLQHNKNQALQLTLGVRRSRKSIEYFQTLLRELTRRGYINPALEDLPDEEELRERARKREGLVKPELAICLSAVKMWVKETLTESSLPTDPLLSSYLLRYFPEPIRNRFHTEIASHPLAYRIIATTATNVLVDSIGITFVHRMCLNYSTSPLTVIKCALAAEHLLHAEDLRRAISRFDTYTENKRYLRLIDELNGAVRDATAWFISYHHDLDLAEIVELYSKDFQDLTQNAPELLVGAEGEMFHLRRGKYEELGLDRKYANMYSAFPRIMVFLEILWAARNSKKELENVARVYSTALHALDVESVLSLEHSFEPESKWDYELLLSSYKDLRRSISLLSCKLLEDSITDPEQISQKVEESENFPMVRDTIREIKESFSSAAAVAVLAKHLLRYQL